MPDAARNFGQQYVKADRGAEHVHSHLDHVRPDYGGHPAFKCVEQGQRDDHEDGCRPAGVQDDRNHDGYGENSYAFGERARYQEYAGGHLPGPRAEPPFHQGIGGKHLAFEVLRQKNC
jgi:hypothetical protein